jgi:hypothetical protein
MVLDGGDIAADVAHRARQYAAGVAEDFQDAFAQAEAERSAEKEADATRKLVHAELQLLQRELALLHAEFSASNPSVALPNPAFEPLLFQNISREQFDSLAANMGNMGVDIRTDSGTLSRDGIKLSWAYNQMQKSLSIQFAELPPYLPFPLITQKIQNIVMSA